MSRNVRKLSAGITLGSGPVMLSVNADGTGGVSPGDSYAGPAFGPIREFSSSGDLVRAIGRNAVVADPSNANEAEAVMVKASGSTFTLTFAKKTADPIAYNAPAADPGTPDVADSVEEALAARDNLSKPSIDQGKLHRFA